MKAPEHQEIVHEVDNILYAIPPTSKKLLQVENSNQECNFEVLMHVKIVHYTMHECI